MNITKDEARILGEALAEAKYELLPSINKETDLKVITALTKLEERLLEEGKDQRRTGRTSLDDFSDCLKRFVKRKE